MKKGKVPLSTKVKKRPTGGKGGGALLLKNAQAGSLANP